MAGALFAATMALLLIPKLLGAVLVARDRAAREACGGVLGLALSVVGEVALSALMAPIFMLMHSRAVVDVLRGRHSGWAAQQRDEGRLKFKRAWSRHWLHTLLGLGWGGAALALDPVLLAWTSPVTVGLVLAIPLSMATARADAGAASRRLGLFMTPEETAGPDVAARAAGLRAQYDAEAQVRFEIDRLFRAPAHVYRPEVQGVPAYLQAA